MVTSEKWNCIGVQQEIDDIKQFINISRRHDKDVVAYRALKSLDKTISNLMLDDDNDERKLMSYRRQVRTLLKEVAT